jgi:ketosteroid isomerase-like protein
MSAQTLRDVVLTYFIGVDTQDIEMIFKTLSDDCVFKVETHGVELVGRAAITGMFERLWARHEWVRHDQFYFVEDKNGNDIAARFQVTNKMHDGALVHKSNCNFFTAKDGLFTEVRVYMTGENTLDAKK